MPRVIARYPGYNELLEEEFYIVLRRRPDKVGQQPGPAPEVNPEERLIHNPSAASVNYRVLTYNVPTEADAKRLAASLQDWNAKYGVEAEVAQ